ncbi:MAG: metallophosphoesterase [Gemmatimonadota bacterium]|nr:MAG: metallophosphoesterase [Gemmatimonadota bacterium]
MPVAILVGAGDIARCESNGDEITAALLDSIVAEATVPTVVFTVGDNAYERATDGKFRECYDPTWGRHKAITRPVPGNHDYKNGFLWFLLGGNASPYFDYFDAFPGQAGDRGDGWYHYQLADWDIYALNSNDGKTVKRDSRQWEWLSRELRERQSTCSIAYLHHPRFSVSKHGDNAKMQDLWDLLTQNGIDIMIAGHDHNYQRFDPQDADGAPEESGIRQFVVGTGGTYLVLEEDETSGQLARWTPDHHGVLKLTLYRERYEWEFIVEDGSVWDAGSSSCQNTRGR